MTGALACPGITSTGINTFSGTNQFNSNISLPAAYNATPNTALPTMSQIGGSNKQVAASIAYTSGTITNLKTISLNQGCYLLIYRVMLYNPSATNATVGALAASISTTPNALDDDFRNSNFYSTSIGQAGQTSISGSGYYQMNTGASTTLYLNYYATASASVNVSGYIQAIRIA